MELKEDDIFEIQEEAWDARSKWSNIGLGLRLPPSDLDVIEKDQGDTDDKFSKMIRKWLRTGKNCTWESLCKVLEARSIGKAHIAKEIRRQKCAVGDDTSAAKGQ